APRGEDTGAAAPRTEEARTSAAPVAEEPKAAPRAAGEAPAQEPPQAEASRKEPRDAEPTEKPRPMGSAERRTDEEEQGRKPLSSAPDFSDDDLSFSRAPQAPSAP